MTPRGSIFSHDPDIMARYRAIEKKRADAKAEQALRDKKYEDERRAKSYDAYVLNGGGDECMRFGINDGCKPWCPVFERGECEMQEENEDLFAEKE